MHTETGKIGDLSADITPEPQLGRRAASAAQSPRFAVLTDIAWGLAVALVFTWITVADDALINPMVSWAGMQAKFRLNVSMRILLNWLAFVPVMLVLLRSWLDANYSLRRAATPMLMAALASWSAISLIWSCDRFDGFLVVGNAIGVWAVTWTIFQTAGTLAWRQLTLAAVAGLFAAVGVGLVAEMAYLHPQRLDTWVSQREAILAATNSGTVSRDAIQRDWNNIRYEFEEPFLSANPLASAAAIFCFSGGALLAAFVRGRHWRQVLWSGLVLCGSLWWLGAARCKTVTLLFIVAIAALCVWQLLRPRCSARRLTIVFAALLGAGILAVIVTGLARGDLLSPSFTGRWVFWTEYLEAASSRWLTGIGTGSFRWYAPEYVPARSLELPKDEHNLFVKSFMELGVLGLVLAVAWVVSLFHDSARGLVDAEGLQPQGKRRLRPVILSFGIALAIGVGLRLTVRESSLFDSLGVLLLELVTFAAVAMVLAWPRLQFPALSSWLLSAGVLVFVLSGQMDMQFSDNRAMLLFGLMLGVLLSAHGAERVLSAKQTRWQLAAVAVAAGVVAIPSSQLLLAELHARRAAVAHYANEPGVAARELEEARRQGGAFATVQYPLVRASILASEKNGFGQALEAWLDAIALNPRENSSRLQLAVKFEKRGQLEAATTMYEDALKLEPRSIVIHAAFASFAEAYGMAALATLHWERVVSLEHTALADRTRFAQPGETPRTDYLALVKHAKTSLAADGEKRRNSLRNGAH